jgi:hypothetical protein
MWRGGLGSPRSYGHDPYAYPKDLLTRPPTQKIRQIAGLPPHQWNRLSGRSSRPICQALTPDVHSQTTFFDEIKPLI